MTPSDLEAPPRVAEPPKTQARLAEFLLIGGATPLLYLLSWSLRRALDLDTAELAVGFTMFHAAYVINDPHFSVTYLLFYKRFRERALGDAFEPSLRARYVFAGVLVPAILSIWAFGSLAARSAVALGWLIQLMFLLVGWHYVKQGFGVMVVLAARRGVSFTQRERMAILAHCFAGWAYAWSTKPNAGKEVEEKGVVFTKLALPPGLDRAALVALVVSLVVVAAVLISKSFRERKLVLITPVTALFVSIWSWSIFSGADPLVRYMIPALHSIQYLYIVSLLSYNEARAVTDDDPPWKVYSAKTKVGLLAVSAIALGWLLFNGAPSLLDAALVSRAERLSDLGPTPYFAALYVVVNLHHYFMDNVIWRRENPAMRYLRSF